ncbi:MAG TPA: hypothetical protein VGW10_08370 [Solirubrobacteraceae bacterium]|nr:hypothetical protein [Solirubrobacteraceae bacterium]
MSRIALAVAALLVFPASASAKGIERAELCGVGGCAEVGERVAMAAAGGGPAVPTAPRGEPHFTLRISIGHGGETMDSFSIRWLPESGLVRDAQGVWMRAPAEAQRELLRLSADLEAVGPRVEREEDDGGGSATALAIGGPAAAALGLAALLARRRRHRR